MLLSFGPFSFVCSCSSFPTVTGWHPGQTTPHVVFSTFGATRSWPCTATITSFVASPRWPLASPAGYSLPATTITIATFGTRFVANEQVINYRIKLLIYFLFRFTVLPARDSFLHGLGRCHRQAVWHSSRPGAGSVFSRQHHLRGHLGGLQQVRPITHGWLWRL